MPADVREGASWTRPQRIKNALIYALIRALVALLTHLPRPLSALLCRAIGAIAYLALPAARRRARERLRAALGHEPPERRVRLAFATLGAMLADTLALLRPSERASRTLAIDTVSHAAFRDALAERRGVVYIAAHLGSWERMAALLVEQGFPVAAAARESYDPRITRLYERIREPRGVRSIYRGRPGAFMAIARELVRGGMVGFLMDLPARVPCARARLFGEDADLPIGPVKIALARKAPVLLGTCAPPVEPGDPGAHPFTSLTSTRRSPPGTPEASIPAVRITRIPSDDLEPGPAGEAELLARIARALDDRIAAWPEAWLGLFVPPRLRGAGDPR